MRIETERLVVRAYQDNDLQEAFELMQDNDLFTYLPMEIMTFEEYKELFSWLIGCYEISPQHDWYKYSFVITRKDDGRHVGWCGIGSLDFNHSSKEIFLFNRKTILGNGLRQ
ncbi:hypothetical protein J31TS3_22310 [Paenibacillus lactis]|nr:hypothetical protein J31TS3_22310 [Paenibacillus lactis]